MKIKTVYSALAIMLALSFSACASDAVAQATQATAEAPIPAGEEAAPVVSESDHSDLAAEPAEDSTEQAEQVSRPAGWTEETHSKSAEQDFEEIFPDDQVNRIDINIDPTAWQDMLDDMTELYGEFGARPIRGGGALVNGGQLPPAQGQDGMPAPPPGQDPGAMPPPPQGEDQRPSPPAGQNQGVKPFNQGAPAGQAPMPSMGDDNNPIWVPVTIEFDGDTWTNVGLRFKGNSSLKSSWNNGVMKFPFKLDFDEFEDDYPEIEDQRFYGFKQLSLASNFNDSSFLREKVTADIFREAGVPAAHTAFYQVYVDYGEGPTYFGLYTMVEVVDDTVIEEQFEDDNGNLYKPEGSGASFAYGSFSEAAFDKETNGDEADWSDILALLDVLNSNLRETDPAAWRTNLESVFDVDGFLNWLAVNTVIQNWDTYGKMPHNYYLYHDPSTDLLTWIPWDNNEALYAGKQGGALSLSLDEATDQWPLIRFLLDDELYHASYVAFVEAIINGAFEPAAMTARYQALHDLIRPYVISETPGYTFLRSAEEFDASLNQLIEHVNGRYAEASAYVNSQ